MTEHTKSTKRGAVPAIIAATLLGIAFALANIPGNPVVGPYVLGNGKYGPHFECSIESVVHGWPFVYLRHDGQYTQSGDLSAWSVGDNVRFTLVPLLVNVALLVVGTSAIGWIVRRRIQKHRCRFGIVHLMIAMLCAAAGAAFFVSRHRLHEAQTAKLRRSQTDIGFAEWQPFGPHWLREITGPQYWQWGDRLVAADVEHSDEITDFPGKRAIKVLRIFTVKCDAMPTLDDYDDLRAIDMFMVNYDYSNFDGNGDPEFWPCLRVISNCKSIRGLNLYDCGVTDRDLRELARMPKLENLELSANPDVTDNGLVQLAPVASLKKLGLWGTSVTKDGVAKLKDALPECKIGWDGHPEETPQNNAVNRSGEVERM